jgi:hypothetical protein
MDETVKEIVAGVVGLLGIFAFMVALAILPWGVI